MGETVEHVENETLKEGIVGFFASNTHQFIVNVSVEHEIPEGVPSIIEGTAVASLPVIFTLTLSQNMGTLS